MSCQFAFQEESKIDGECESRIYQPHNGSLNVAQSLKMKACGPYINIKCIFLLAINLIEIIMCR